jgi:Family of unknown function (DUF6186)
VTPYAVIAAGFGGLVVAALVVEVLGRAGRGPFHPLGPVVRAALGSVPGRWAVLLAWAWLGFHFLAR